MNRPPASGTFLEIDRTCFEANLEALQKEIAPSKLCMVVKGNAYGHGYHPMIPIAEAAGIRDFAVFSAREAAGFLAASDGQSRLMVMGHSEQHNVPWLLANGVEPWVNDVGGWDEIRMACDAGQAARVHLELETGMHRTGVLPDNAFDIACEVADHDDMVLEGVCTHLAGRESSANDGRVQQQMERFHGFVERLKEAGIEPNVRHMSSSAAALLDPECRLDLCRVGIACYGLWPSAEVRAIREARPNPPVLRNVMTWKSSILSVQTVPSGDYIGYGTSYQADHDTRVAILGVGYADGFARALSNQGHVLIRGMRAPIVGNVNMNMVQVDITHIESAEVGDEATLIGRQGDHEISVSSFSDFNQIINYELMARISHELPRIVKSPPVPAPPLE